MGAIQAISKLEQKFQNRIRRELDKNFGIPGIIIIHWIIRDSTFRIVAIEIWVFNHFLPFRSYRYLTSILSSRIDLTSFFSSFSPIFFNFQQNSSVFIKFLKILNRTIFIGSYEVLFDFFWLFVWFFDFIESFVFVWCQTWCVLSYEPHERKVTRTYSPSYYRIRTFIWIKTGLLKVSDFLSKLAANWKKQIINNQYFQRSHWRIEIRLWYSLKASEIFL